MLVYINLILGGVVLLALYWLLFGRRGRKDKPSEILQDEINKRRAVLEEGEAAARRYRILQEEHLKGVECALQDMLSALPPADREAGLLSWQSGSRELSLCVKSREECRSALEQGGLAEPEEFFITWDIKDYDIPRLAAPMGRRAPAGMYCMRWGGGRRMEDTDLIEFIRRISGIIADRLV